MIAYFDTFSGASGDMIVGALLDAGLPLDELRAELAKLPLAGYSLRASKVQKGPLAATKFDVLVEQPGHGHRPSTGSVRQAHGPSLSRAGRHDPVECRNLADITALIDASALSDLVKDKARRIFTRLAEAEGAVHGQPAGEVHFHEVGAVDSIIDIVGAVVALERLGVTRVFSGPLRLGSGSVESRHGLLPLPAPATVRLAEGFPIEPTDVRGELTTPTGAAVLTTLAESFGPPPPMTLVRSGVGAGSADYPGRPNVLRVLIGREEPAASGRVVVLEANLDDATGEMIGYAAEALLAAGALDVFAVPILMKKSRPGTLLCVIARPEDRAKLEAILLRETTTFGVRWSERDRTMLDRRSVEVTVLGTQVRVKLGLLDGRVIHVAPEYEDCARLAREKNIPLRDIYDAARKAAQPAD